MRNLLDKKIPTLLGLLVIFLGIAGTTFLVKGGTLFEIRATPLEDPKNIEITNISDVALTVSYITDDKVIGTLNYGESPNMLDEFVLDDRDQISQSVNKYKVHSITVRGLEPKTTYYFQINSGDKTYKNNDSFYKVQTGSYIKKNPLEENPISGKVIGPDGKIPEEGLVFVSTAGSQKLSTHLKSDGTYTIPLNILRNNSLSDYLELFENSIINIEVISESLFSSVSISANEISPVPLITLSNSYDFSTSQQKTEADSKKPTVAFPTFGKLRAKPTPSENILGKKISTTPTEAPSPNPTLSPARDSSVTIALIGGIAAIAGGLILFLLTRKQISL